MLTHLEYLGWEFHEDETGRLTVSDGIEMPLIVPGRHAIQLNAQASNAIVNEDREPETVMARCSARFDVRGADTQAHIAVTFKFDAPSEGHCSVARRSEPMEPEFTSEPTPSS